MIIIVKCCIPLASCTHMFVIRTAIVYTVHVHVHCVLLKVTSVILYTGTCVLATEFPPKEYYVHVCVYMHLCMCIF